MSTHVDQGDLTADLLNAQMRRKRIEERLKKKKALKPANKANMRLNHLNNYNLLMDTEYLDWWSKYYGSIKQFDPFTNLKNKQNPQNKQQEKESSSSSSSSSSSCSSSPDSGSSSSSAESENEKKESRIKRLKFRRKNEPETKHKEDTDDDVFMDNSNSDEQKPKSILKKQPRRNSKTKKLKPKHPPVKKKVAKKYTICKSKSKLYKNVQKIQVSKL